MRALLPCPSADDPDAPAFELLMQLWNGGTFRAKTEPQLQAAVRTTRAFPVLELRGEVASVEEARTLLRDALGTLGVLTPEGVPAEALRRLVVRARVDELSLVEKPHYYGLMRAGLLATTSVDKALAEAEALGRVTPQDVARVAARFFRGTPRFRLAVVGEGLEALDIAGFADLAGEVAGAQTQNQATAPPAESAPAVASGKTGTAPAAKPALLQKKLPNGLVLIVQQNPASEMFAVHLLAKDRSAREPEGKDGIADLLHRCLIPGTKNPGGEEVKDLFDRIGATVKVTDLPGIPFDDYYFTGEYSYVRLETTQDAAADALAGLAALVASPALSQESLDTGRKDMTALLEREAGSAKERSRRLFREKLFAGHPLSRPVLGTTGSLGSITLDDLRAFHKAYFAPGNLILSVVSGLPAEEAAKLVEQSFGKIPTGPSLAPVPKLGKSTSPETIREPLGRGQSSLYMGRLLDVPEKDLPALQVWNFLYSDRIAFDLREKQGLAYVIGSSVPSGAYGTWFLVTMGTGPENLDKALAGIQKHLDGLLTEEIPARDLERAINQTWGRSLMRRLASIHVAYSLGLGAFEAGDPEHSLRELEALRKVTPAEAQAAARKHLGGKIPLVVVVE